MLGEGIDAVFVARPFTDQVEQIRARHEREIVYLPLGASNTGLDLKIDVSGRLLYRSGWLVDSVGAGAARRLHLDQYRRSGTNGMHHC